MNKHPIFLSAIGALLGADCGFPDELIPEERMQERKIAAPNEHRVTIIEKMVRAVKKAYKDLSDKEKLDLRMQSMEGHTPGKTINMSDGTRYKVAFSGAWQRITHRSCITRKRGA